jgi:hypothetical protein
MLISTDILSSTTGRIIGKDKENRWCDIRPEAEVTADSLSEAASVIIKARLPRKEGGPGNVFKIVACSGGLLDQALKATIGLHSRNKHFGRSCPDWTVIVVILKYSFCCHIGILRFVVKGYDF